jgi:hypothetical protein
MTKQGKLQAYSDTIRGLNYEDDDDDFLDHDDEFDFYNEFDDLDEYDDDFRERQRLDVEKKKVILVVSDSNTAVDKICIVLLRKGFKVVRILSKNARNRNDLDPLIEKICHIVDDKTRTLIFNLFGKFQKWMAKSPQLAPVELKEEFEKSALYTNASNTEKHYLSSFFRLKDNLQSVS